MYPDKSIVVTVLPKSAKNKNFPKRMIGLSSMGIQNIFWLIFFTSVTVSQMLLLRNVTMSGYNLFIVCRNTSTLISRVNWNIRWDKYDIMLYIPLVMHSLLRDWPQETRKFSNAIIALTGNYKSRNHQSRTRNRCFLYHNSCKSISTFFAVISGCSICSFDNHDIPHDKGTAPVQKTGWSMIGSFGKVQARKSNPRSPG